MQIASPFAFPVLPLLWEAQPARWMLTVLVKATFRLLPGEEAVLADTHEPLAGDRPWDGSPGASLFCPTDRVPFKQRADVLLVGHAYAPRGVAVESTIARLQCAGVDKAVRVTGNRVWAVGPAGPVPSAIAPFTAMAIRHEHAEWSSNNPHGVRRARGGPLPNIEAIDPGASTGTFGPLDPSSSTRRGRLDDAAMQWAYRLAGPPPEGFDYDFFNAAPPEQRVQRILPGSSLRLEHFHPHYEVLETRLPSLRPRAVLDGRREIELAIDTLWIDVDRSRVVLSWRGATSVEASAWDAGRLEISADRATSANIGSVTAPPPTSFAAALPGSFAAPASVTFGAPPSVTFGAPPSVTFGAPPSVTFGAPPMSARIDAAGPRSEPLPSPAGAARDPGLPAISTAVLAPVRIEVAPAQPSAPRVISRAVMQTIGPEDASKKPSLPFAPHSADRAAAAAEPSPAVITWKANPLGSGTLADPNTLARAFEEATRSPLPFAPEPAPAVITWKANPLGSGTLADSDTLARAFEEATKLPLPFAPPSPDRQVEASVTMGPQAAPNPVTMGPQAAPNPGTLRAPAPAPEQAPAPVSRARPSFVGTSTLVDATPTKPAHEEPTLPFFAAPSLDRAAPAAEPAPAPHPNLPYPGTVTELAPSEPTPARPLPFFAQTIEPPSPTQPVPPIQLVQQASPIQPFSPIQPAAPSAPSGEPPVPRSLRDQEPAIPLDARTDLLPIEAYASMKAALWEGAARAEVLRRHDLDEGAWHLQEELQSEALAAEAREGRCDRALALAAALRATGEPVTGAPRRLGLEAYVALRVAIERSPDPDAPLAAKGLARAEWERIHRDFSQRARSDVGLRERLGAMLLATRARAEAESKLR